MKHVDYATTGMSIQAALKDLSARTRAAKKELRLPVVIPWGSREIQVSDLLAVPRRGMLRIRLLSELEDPPFGVDVETAGAFHVRGAGDVPLLRTWNSDPSREVAYPFESRDGVLRTWPVYMIKRGREWLTEKWTGNAGFWVEHVTLHDRIYHCSHGDDAPPNFERFVYRLTVSPRDDAADALRGARPSKG